MPLSVVRITPIVAHGRRGVQVGEALFSDGLTARFRISSVDQTDVQMVDPGLPAAYRLALRAWLAQQVSSDTYFYEIRRQVGQPAT
jgi:hypothetical protein